MAVLIKLQRMNSFMVPSSGGGDNKNVTKVSVSIIFNATKLLDIPKKRKERV